MTQRLNADDSNDLGHPHTYNLKPHKLLQFAVHNYHLAH